jgi:hypothetical protein
MDLIRMNQVHTRQYPIIDEEPNVDEPKFFLSFERFWRTIMGWFTIKSDNGLGEAGYNIIIKWTRSILPEWNRLKENFYTAKSMMKPLDLGY